MRPWKPRLLRLCLLLIAMGLALGVAKSSVVKHWLARSDGYVIVVDQPQRVLAAKADDSVLVAFQLTNVTSEPVEVVGLRTGCGCSSAEPIPCTIAAHSSETLRLTVSTRGEKPGDILEIRPEYFVDCPTRKVGMSIRVNVTR